MLPCKTDSDIINFLDPSSLSTTKTTLWEKKMIPNFQGLKLKTIE